MSPARRLNDRHPFEIYLLVWALLASAPAALGLTAIPASVSRQLPGIPGRIWVTALSFGCLLALTGLAWRRPTFPRVTVTGLLLEQVGLIVVGFATLFYALAAVAAVGLSALIPAGIVLAFGCACFAQALKIQRVLQSSRST